MKTGQDFLMDLWRDKVGLQPLPEKQKIPPPDEIRKTEWSPLFEKLMRNRLAMGIFRYGPIATQNLGSYDMPAEAIKRIELFINTSNLEYLIDAANICMLAFIQGEQEGLSMKSIDDGCHNKVVR